MSMAHGGQPKKSVTSWEYIHDNFEPSDRLAIVIKREWGKRLVQRIASADEIAASRFQAWMKSENLQGGEIYLGMNPLKADARGRTKQDIAVVRHVYLDLDSNGNEALAAILSDQDLPRPSYVLNTSTGKYQVIWKVTGFSIEQAERLQRAMACSHGADRAATDVTRVLRIPGFQNCKYRPAFQVTAERVAEGVRTPNEFCIDLSIEAIPSTPAPGSRTPLPQGRNSQSERDWAETLRRLERGEDPVAVRAWLEKTRQDKPNPGFYAALTVRKAVARLERRSIAGPSLERS